LDQAFFLRAIHTEFSSWRRLIVITNDWHMDRTRSIFETIFSLPLSLPSSYFSPSPRYTLEFIEVDSLLASPEILKARQEREKQSLHFFLTNTKTFWRTFNELHQWIFTKHTAYASSRFLSQAERLDEKTLQTY
jgi:hypothetical protein